MMLNYIALAILLIALTLVFYTIIYIHDIPYTIAKERNHPQKEVIHVASWLSLIMLHALWPFLFMWAVWRPAPAVPMPPDEKEDKNVEPTLDTLVGLERRVEALEKAIMVKKGV